MGHQNLEIVSTKNAPFAIDISSQLPPQGIPIWPYRTTALIKIPMLLSRGKVIPVPISRRAFVGPNELKRIAGGSIQGEVLSACLLGWLLPSTTLQVIFVGWPGRGLSWALVERFLSSRCRRWWWSHSERRYRGAVAISRQRQNFSDAMWSTLHLYLSLSTNDIRYMTRHVVQL